MVYGNFVRKFICISKNTLSMHNIQDSFSVRHHPPEGSQPGTWKDDFKHIFHLKIYI